jgi:Spy/CpxP family protein refolding chaperone
MTVISRLFAGLAVCALGLSVMPAQAAPQGPMGQRQQGMAAMLQLTPDQKAKFEALHNVDGPMMETRRKAVKEQEMAVERLFADEKASARDVEGAFAKLHSLRAETMAARAKHFLAMRAMLTPAQRKIFIAQHPMADNGMGHGQPHGPQGKPGQQGRHHR